MNDIVRTVIENVSSSDAPRLSRVDCPLSYLMIVVLPGFQDQEHRL